MRYVTNEQRRRQALFKPTRRAPCLWPIFCVAHSSRINLDMLVLNASAARTALKIGQIRQRRYATYLRDDALDLTIV
jgi:hypothetical protein